MLILIGPISLSYLLWGKAKNRKMQPVSRGGSHIFLKCVARKSQPVPPVSREHPAASKAGQNPAQQREPPRAPPASPPRAAAWPRRARALGKKFPKGAARR